MESWLIKPLKGVWLLELAALRVNFKNVYSNYTSSSCQQLLIPEHITAGNARPALKPGQTAGLFFLIVLLLCNLNLYIVTFVFFPLLEQILFCFAALLSHCSKAELPPGFREFLKEAVGWVS